MISKIYIIVITYNGEQYIEKCLSALLKSNLNLQIVIIDNASQDNTIKIIEYNFSQIKLIKLKKNIGFGRANNIGIKYAYDNDADYILLLNQDVWVKPVCIKKLITVHKKNNNYGIISPIHLNRKQNSLDLHFSEFLLDSSLTSHLISDLILKKNKKLLYEVNAVNAAAWCISRKCIEKVGLFNPSFFHYGEDLNYCERVNYHGLKVGIATDAFIVHNRNQYYFGQEKADLNRDLMKKKAEINLRLSRIVKPTSFNILSIMQYIIFSQPKKKRNFFNLIKFKFILFYYVISNFKKLIKSRIYTINGDKVFFKKAEIDAKKFIYK